MKRNKLIFAKKTLAILTIISSISLTSCDLGELMKVEDIKVKTETKVVLPLAYGRVELQTLVDYVNAYDTIITPDKDGYFSFAPLDISEFEYPSDFEFDGSKLDALSYLELRIETENRFPLGIYLELVFSDSYSNTQYGPSIKCHFMEPAVLDQSGKVTKSTHHVETVLLTKKIITQYKKANTLSLNVRFFMPETDNDSIYINKEDFLSLNVGVIVQPNANENQ
jgi:hypothetical protein